MLFELVQHPAIQEALIVMGKKVQTPTGSKLALRRLFGMLNAIKDEGAPKTDALARTVAKSMRSEAKGRSHLARRVAGLLVDYQGYEYKIGGWVEMVACLLAAWLLWDDVGASTLVGRCLHDASSENQRLFKKASKNAAILNDMEELAPEKKRRVEFKDIGGLEAKYTAYKSVLDGDAHALGAAIAAVNTVLELQAETLTEVRAAIAKIPDEPVKRQTPAERQELDRLVAIQEAVDDDW